jgi:hypothetical protein
MKEFKFGYCIPVVFKKEEVETPSCALLKKRLIDIEST